MRYSFQSGFLDYVNRVELERLDALAMTIAEEYENQGDWRFIKHKKGIWHRLIISHLRSAKGGKYTLENFDNNQDQQSLDLTDLGLRLALLDSEKTFVAGNLQFGDNAELKPIYNSAEEIIGWLSIMPSTALVDTVDIQFTEQQEVIAIAISVVSVFLAALIAVGVAQHLLRPIKSLAHATRELSAGKFDTRIDVTGVDELGQLQNDFNSLALTLEKNEQSRRQWIADISHELRTPMAVLLGEVEALQDGVRKPTETQILSLHSEIVRVNKLIDDLYSLSMSDIGALNYRKEEIELTAVLDDVVTSFNEQLRNKSIQARVKYDTGHPYLVFADIQRLYQLFSNLLQNTLRYTNPGGRCDISCEESDGKVTVNWQDSEPGVPDHLLDRLFDRLFRAEESRNRESGGAGLGLSICRNIIEAHDGKITVQRSSIGGLWFKISFPAAFVKTHQIY